MYNVREMYKNTTDSTFCLRFFQNSIAKRGGRNRGISPETISPQRYIPYLCITLHNDKEAFCLYYFVGKQKIDLFSKYSFKMTLLGLEEE